MYFSNASLIVQKISDKLRFSVFSDVNLDSDAVQKGLDQAFKEFAAKDCIPHVMVLCGNFGNDGYEYGGESQSLVAVLD